MFVCLTGVITLTLAIQFTALVDINAHRAHTPIHLEKREFFGELRKIIVLHLPASNTVRGLSEPVTLMLAEVAQALTDYKGPVASMCFYEKTATPEIIDLASVQCLVGRFQTSTSGKRIWAIIDRSGPLARAEWGGEGQDGTI